MAVNLTVGAWSILSNQEMQTMDLKPVVQVTDIQSLRQRRESGCRVEDDGYKLVLSDGSYCQRGILDSDLDALIRSQQLQKGSVVRLTRYLTVKDVNVIGKYDIIGDPQPMTYGFRQPGNKNKERSCPSQIPSKKQKCESSNPKNSAVAEDTPNNASMTMEKNKEDDDVGACFEKLEKLGWGTQDPLYDTALFLFGESGVYRKLWLLLKPESCGKWVRNAGRKYGLSG